MQLAPFRTLLRVPRTLVTMLSAGLTLRALAALASIAVGACLFSPATAQAQVTFTGVQTNVGGSFTGGPYAVAVDASGNVYVAESGFGGGLSSVKEMLAVNGVVPASPTIRTFCCDLGYPTGVAVDASGNVYFSDAQSNKVEEMLAVGGVVSTSPTIVTLAGPATFSGSSSPGNLAVDSSGNVFVSNWNVFDSSNNVYEIPAGCVAAGCVVTIDVGFSTPQGVAVDASGNLYVADTGNLQVEELAPPYTSSVVLDNNPGYWSAHGVLSVALDASGNLYVGEANGAVELTASSNFSTAVQVGSSLNNGSISELAVGAHGVVYEAQEGSENVVEVQTQSANFGGQAIGSSSATQNLFFTVTAGTTVGSVAVLTQGAPSLDFTIASTTGAVCTAKTYSSTASCIVHVKFTPAAAGARAGAVVIFDGSGNVLASVPLLGVGTGPQVAFGANPLVQGKQFSYPDAIAVDASGNQYVGDAGTGFVYKVTPSGTKTTLPTNVGYLGGVAVDGAGNVYLSDINSQLIYEETPAGVQSQASSFVFNTPMGMVMDAQGDLFVADEHGAAVYEISAAQLASGPTNYSSGTPPTVGTFNGPVNVAVDASGNLYVDDAGAAMVYKVTPNGVQTQVGSNFVNPWGVAVDAAGDVYVADQLAGTIDEVTPAGIQTTLNTLGGNLQPNSLAISGAGNLYFTNGLGSPLYAYELVQATPPSLGFATTSVGSTSTDSPQTVSVSNIGNAALTFTALSYATDFPVNASDTNLCSTSTGLGSSLECDVSINFTPLSVATLSEHVTLTDNALNAAGTQQSIAVTGKGTPTPIPAAISTPTPGPSTILGTTQAFTWSTGTGVTSYQLWLGTNGAGTFDLYNSGTIYGTTKTVSGIPANGVLVYARLLSKINGAWQSRDYTYTESGAAASATLSTPTPGLTTILGTSQAFTWSTGTGVTAYQLWLGTNGVGTFNIYNSGSTIATSATASSIPASGLIVYARLLSRINGLWQSVDYTYTESGTAAPATISTPTPGPTSMLGTSQAFTWSTGTGVTAYQLWLGTNGAGTFNIYNSGSITSTTATASSIPANGVIVYARLLSEINGAWQANDYTYIESGTATPAALAAPTPVAGSVLGTTQTFNWTTGTGVTAYQLWLGTTGVGSFDIYNSGSTAATSETVSGIPANGVTLYVRLFSKVNATWESADYTYIEPGTATPATISTPIAGPTTILGTSQAFTWSTGTGVTAYQLWLGTTGVGSSDIYNSGSTPATSKTVSSIPANGVLVYVSLFSKINGAWQSNDYTYTESGTATPAAISTPIPGPSTVLGTSQAFTWSTGAGATAYQLWLGTTGVGSFNLYDSNSITATSVTVSSIPANGVIVYVRLLSEINGAWQSNDYTYTESGTATPAALAAPTPVAGSVLGASQAFNWTTGTGVTAYQLWLGTTGVGSFDIYNSGSTTATSETVSGIPENGVTIYVRLFSKINGVWQPIDTTYTETGAATAAALAAPTPVAGSVLGASQAFNWTTGTGVTAYQLWLGTTGVGTFDIYNSGSTTATAETVSGIPANGVTIYVRLFSKINGAWQPIDYTYTETGTTAAATLTAPTLGTLLGSSQTFNWSPGTGVTSYQLWLGTTGVGSLDVYDSGSTIANTETVSGIPQTGGTIYVRVFSKINGAWVPADYTFTEQ